MTSMVREREGDGARGKTAASEALVCTRRTFCCWSEQDTVTVPVLDLHFFI